MRLVPPRLGEVERRTHSGREAERWARALYVGKRRWLWMAAGNVALLALLVGLPFVRGQARARASERSYQTLAGCLYGASVRGGLGDFAAESELLAGALVRSDRAWLPRCVRLLDATAPEPAIFVLPSVKQAEDRVRDAAAILRNELLPLATYAPGAAMPDRAARALKLLRETIRAQLETTGISDREAALPMHVDGGRPLPAPARLPLYAAPDASLFLEGDDHTLRVSALDATGLSYLEIEPGKPFTRARLVRPRLLRGMVTSGARSWLLWATSPARCAERANGCFGKTTQVALAPRPLLELPETRALAAHLGGRPDRSVADAPGGLVIATATAERRVLVREFALADGFAVGDDLPPLSAARSWSSPVDQALVLPSERHAVVLGLTRGKGHVQLAQLGADAALPIASLKTHGDFWLTGCARDGRVAFAFGDGSSLRAGELARSASGLAPQLWDELTLSSRRQIDPEEAGRDGIVTLCTRDGTLVLVRDAADELRAFACRRQDVRCLPISIAAHVRHFSALATSRGVLVAYAGEATPQVRIRQIDTGSAAIGAEVIPAACWSSGKGMCGRPVLARLGTRILLVAPEKTDLNALESADEGQSWRPPPTL
jgi:hypothetical protein